MSTQTTRTRAGSMLPTPIPCSIVDSTNTRSTPASAAAYQLAEVLDAAGVQDDRPSDKRDASAGVPDFAHHRGNLADAHFYAPFGRDVIRHECEAKPIAFAEFRHDANAIHTTDDLIPS